jgi:hypothetical protein
VVTEVTQSRTTVDAVCAVLGLRPFPLSAPVWRPADVRQDEITTERRIDINPLEFLANHESQLHIIAIVAIS